MSQLTKLSRTSIIFSSKLTTEQWFRLKISPKFLILEFPIFSWAKNFPQKRYFSPQGTIYKTRAIFQEKPRDRWRFLKSPDPRSDLGETARSASFARKQQLCEFAQNSTKTNKEKHGIEEKDGGVVRFQERIGRPFSARPSEGLTRGMASKQRRWRSRIGYAWRRRVR